MPGILRGYDPNNKDVNSAADKERRDRMKLIDAYWRYYDGDHAMPLKVLPGQRNDNIILNLCGRAIDKTIEFIGLPTRFEVPGGVNNEPNPAAQGELVELRTTDQDTIDAAWKKWRKDLPDIIQSGLIAGHTFIKLHLDSEGKACMSLLDPRCVSVFWDITNPREILFYRQEWKMGKDHRRQDIVPNALLNATPAEDGAEPTAAEGWSIIEYAKSQTNEWREVSRDSWDYPFSPIIDWKNKRRAHAYYGDSALKEATINDAVNFVITNMARIIKFHAHPRTVGIGFDAGQLQTTSADGFMTIPNKDAQVMNLEMQSDLGSSLNLYSILVSEFFTQQRVVDVSSIKDKLGQITNFGVRMIFSDMLGMSNEKREFINDNIGEAIRRLLWIDGLQLIEAPTAQWDDPLPSDRKEIVEALEKEKALGATSIQTIREDLGRDNQVETERIAEEGNNAGAALGNILQTFGEQGGFESSFGGRRNGVIPARAIA